jgi:SAM-dependent methyltransferase
LGAIMRADLELELHGCRACGSDRWKQYRRQEGWQLVRCLDCDAVHLNPSPSESELERLYTAEYYQDHQLQEDHSPAVVEQEIVLRMSSARRLMEEAPSPCRWLDIGCASGYLLAAARKLGCEVEGIEISEWAADFASTMLGLKVFRGTVGQYMEAWDGRRFGLITAMAYLEHSLTPRDDVQAVARLLVPGGVFVMRLPNRASFDRFWHGNSWRGWSLPYHLYHFNPSSLRRLMSQAGLTPFRFDGGFWNPIVHWRESRRGDGLRADHPLEGRHHEAGAAASRSGTIKNAAAPLIGWTRKLLGRVLTGRDMILYARR